MLPVAQTSVSLDTNPLLAFEGNLSHTEGRRIRFAAADLYKNGQLCEAEMLTRAALQHYPDNEDVLIIRALICEVTHDWSAAASALALLVKLQGPNAPVEAWSHWVRVLRCDGQYNAALEAVLQGLQLHPAHPKLASELAQLEALAASPQPKAA
jgi:tetratricopeptide (TPR) repeat protein